MAASHRNQPEATSGGLKAGYDLYHAASRGDIDDILRLWEEHGDQLDVEWEDEHGFKPLHVAATGSHPDACRVLVRACRANIDSRAQNRTTPLILAVASNNTKCVEVLLELGADVTLRDNENDTALDTARHFGYTRMPALLERAATPMVKSALKV
jgi:ankyrin repeat protein